MDVRTGRSADLGRTVGAHDTAAALGSGSLPVLGTPRLLAWAEEATVAALEGGLTDGETSVGVRVVLEHTAPSAVGDLVHVHAEVASVHGRRVVLEVRVSDAAGRPLGGGTVERAVVDAAAFAARLAGGGVSGGA